MKPLKNTIHEILRYICILKVRSRLNIFLQSGGGAFYLASVYELPIALSRIAAGDIDGDGLNDLIVLGDDNWCMVMLQSHHMPGTFNPPKSLLN